jgi:cell division protein ZapD
LSHQILYEHPLNEQCRSLLRLSHLFEQFEYHLSKDSLQNSRSALASLLDIVSILARADLKSELIKTLEKQHKNLAAMTSKQGVDQRRLEQILQDISHLSRKLKSNNCQLGQSLRVNEFLKTISQRISIPGGSFDFDLPQFHFWLHLPHAERVLQLDDWRQKVLVVQNTVDLLLSLIRSSNHPKQVIAGEGIYQQSLDSRRSVQLIQVMLPEDANVYAVISGNKHRFCVRVMENTDWERPNQTSRDIPFSLKICLI